MFRWDEDTIVIIEGSGSAVVAWGPTFGPGSAAAAMVTHIIGQALGQPSFNLHGFLEERQNVTITMLTVDRSGVPQVIRQTLVLPEIETILATVPTVAQSLAPPSFTVSLPIAESVAIALTHLAADYNAQNIVSTLSLDLVNAAYSLGQQQALTMLANVVLSALGLAQSVSLVSLGAQYGAGQSEAIALGRIDANYQAYSTRQAISGELTLALTLAQKQALTVTEIDTTFPIGQRQALLLAELDLVYTALVTRQAAALSSVTFGGNDQRIVSAVSLSALSAGLLLAATSTLALTSANLSYALADRQAASLGSVTVALGSALTQQSKAHLDSIVYSTTTNTGLGPVSFLSPTGATVAIGEVYGGGGSGGGGSATNAGGGGGGGGYSKTNSIPFTAGTTNFTIVSGTNRAGGAALNNGADGGQSYVSTTGTVPTSTANGTFADSGKGGAVGGTLSPGAPGAGAPTTGAVGDTKTAGNAGVGTAGGHAAGPIGGAGGNPGGYPGGGGDGGGALAAGKASGGGESILTFTFP